MRNPFGAQASDLDSEDKIDTLPEIEIPIAFDPDEQASQVRRKVTWPVPSQDADGLMVGLALVIYTALAVLVGLLWAAAR